MQSYKKHLSLRFLLFMTAAIAAIVIRFYYAWQFQSRIWIDELWVVQNPAFRLLTGVGDLTSLDWGDEIRTWLPPSILFLFLKLLQILGIQKGTLVLPLVRASIGAATLSGIYALLALLFRVFRGKIVLATIALLFAPELIRFSASCDLSILAFPFLAWGLYFYFDLTSQTFRKRIRLLGVFFIGISVFIRMQLASVWLVLLYDSLREKKPKSFHLFFTGSVLAAILDLGLNRILYQHWTIPILKYFYVNTAEHLASSFGTTPFYAAFEIMWKMLTEPVFFISFGTVLALAALFLVDRLRNKTQFFKEANPRTLVLAAAILVFSHVIIPHKEFRFFYIPAIFLSAVGLSVFELWVSKMKYNSVFLALFLILFSGTATWRAHSKVDWKVFEVPTSLETLAGAQTDIQGLIVYGWGGIHSGGAYTFYRTLPYVFSEDLRQLRQRSVDPKLYNYLIAPQSEPRWCADVIAEKDGAALYKCGAQELVPLLQAHSN